MGDVKGRYGFMAQCLTRVYVLMLVLCLVGCGQSGSESAQSYEVSYDAMDETYDADRPVAEVTVDARAQTQEKRIRRAELSLEVEDLKEAELRVRETISAHRGRIDGERLEAQSWRDYKQWVVRVPVERFDEVLDALQNVAKKVQALDIRVEDVTRASADLRARLHTLQATEARYLEILERAESVSDVLAVEAQLSDVRMRIEQLQAQDRALEDHVQMSTIVLRMYTERVDRSTEGASFGQQLLDAVRWGVHGLRRVVVVLVSLWPFVLLASALALWIRRRRKHHAK